MPTIFIDADACAVKEEIYRVAGRYGIPVVLVANTVLRIPLHPDITAQLCRGFGEVDDWIVERSGEGDLVVTSDIPLAARCLAKGVEVLGPKGFPFTENNIGHALGMRDLSDHLRQTGAMTGGPSAITAKDRSRFLAKLDEVLSRIRRAYPGEENRLRDAT